MRAFLILLMFVLALSCACGDDATPTPDPANLVRIHVRVDHDGPKIPWGSRSRSPFIFEFAGHRATTLDEFKVAVLTLPQGTELRWVGDCVWFTDLPLRGPVTAITDVQAFCTAHGVTFHYMPGGY